MDKHEQLYLRVKQGSEFDNIMRLLMANNGRASVEDVIKAGGGAKQWSYMPTWFARFFDNISFVKKGNQLRGNYVNPIPSAPQSVGVDVKVQSVPAVVGGDGSNQALQPAAPVEEVKWPQMPPMCSEMENFVEPAWYKTMRAMIERGKHIALAGPPGTGKDTAVIQLAAEEGMPLVTIGGDAGFRRRDLVGTPQISNGHSFFEVAEYAAAVINGWWVLLTEVNAADADALMFINSQLAAPYVCVVNGKAYPVHKNFRLFVSYNPGLVGTKPLPQAFKDRFFSIQVPFFNDASLRKILHAHGMPEVDRYINYAWPNVLVKFALDMWDAYERGQLRYQITTRRLIDAIVLMVDGLETDIKEAIKIAAIAAIDSPVEAKVAKDILARIV